MPDIKVTVSVDVAGLKTHVPMPMLAVQAVDRVTAVLPRLPAGGAGPGVPALVQAAPEGARLEFVLVTADRYSDAAAPGVRILRAAADPTGIALQAPVLLAGSSLLAALPLAAHELRFVNDSPDHDITVEILVGRAAVVTS